MTADTLIFVIYCLTVGIVIAFVWSLITKAVYGKLIDALIKNECETPDSAMTLDALGVKNNLLLSRALTKNRALDRLVKEENGHYYLPVENKLKAQCLYGKERVSVVTVIVAFLLFFAVVMICNYVIPAIF
ncbi:MAG: hypothetical protein IJ323_01690 [Clostridia bacterium]|nr:hypothetical protein [Clostridia bacterium]